jgi:P-type E1-E2 ATPase
VVGVRTAPGGAWDHDDVLCFAASAESASEHPLGRAVVAAARDRGIGLLSARGFSAAVGSGVTATVAGRAVSVGSPASAGGSETAAVAAMVEEEQASGRTAIVVALDGSTVGVLSLSDRVRSEAAQAVADLRACTDHKPVLLTGDNARAAAALAAEVGMSEVRADLLPQDKVGAVRDLHQDGQRVLLVGDGINDAPALATADIGVAMGGIGSDLALATADVVIVRDDLRTLPAVVRLSRRARRLIVQNLSIAATVIAVLVAWDLVGDLPLPLGVAGHEGSTILVALNGLRLLRRSEWTAR